jgi:hypothetical protein
LKPLTIISGGQTGADRAALDAAIERGVPCGGWCPDGRLAEDGAVPERYPVVALPGGSYDDRTRRNVADADATVIVCFGPPAGGTETTRLACLELRRPMLVIDAAAVAAHRAGEQIAAFVAERRAATLNIAGPRASEQPSIAGYVQTAVAAALDRIASTSRPSAATTAPSQE